MIYEATWFKNNISTNEELCYNYCYSPRNACFDNNPASTGIYLETFKYRLFLVILLAKLP